MKYGAFGLVEVLGDANAVLVVDQMLKEIGRASCRERVCLYV